MAEPRISSYYVHWLHDYTLAQGGISLGLLPSKDSKPFYAMQDWSEKLQQAADALADPDLGLNFGRTITPHRFGVLGYLLHHCDSLGHSFIRMQQYRRLLFHLQNSVLQKTSTGYLVGWQLSAHPSFHEESFTLASILQFARTLTGQQIQPVSAGLMSPTVADHGALEAFLGCPIVCSQPMTSFTCDQSLLALKNTKPDASLRAVLEEQANAMLAALPQQDDLLLLMRRNIVALLQEGEPTLERVAAKLNLSPRTLHRRLAERNLRFRELLEKTRRELAESYLCDARISLAEVALLLGYSEQSPFTHAFKRWTGSTPFDWRKQKLQEDKSR